MNNTTEFYINPDILTIIKEYHEDHAFLQDLTKIKAINTEYLEDIYGEIDFKDHYFHNYLFFYYKK